MGSRFAYTFQVLRVKVKKRTGEGAPVREYYSTDVLIAQVQNGAQI